MVSLPLSSLCLSRNPKFLHFTFKTSLQTVRQPKSDDFPSKIRVPVCQVSQKKMVFPNLQADDFRHPVDKESAERYRAAPNLKELEDGARAQLVAEGSKLIGDIKTAIMATPSQHSDLYDLMAETADILNVRAPLLYVQSSHVPLARLVALDDEPYIVVHTSLLELLTRQEQQVVLAHELAHLKCNHYLWLKAIDIFVHEVKAIPDWFFQTELKDIFRQAQAAELSCDRASLLVSQDPKVVISTIMKLAGGCHSLTKELDVDAYLTQARAYMDASSSTPAGRYREAHGIRLSHPVPWVRAYEIEQWSKSEEYTRLLSTATTRGQAIVRKKIIERLLDHGDFEKIVDKILEQVDIERIIE